MLKKIFASKFNKDLIITIVGQLVIMVLALLVNKVVSVNSTEDVYSIYSVAKKICGLIGGIMAAALGIALPRYMAMKQNQMVESRKYRYLVASLLIVFAISLLVGLGLIVFDNFFAVAIFNDMELVYLIFPMVLYSFSIGVSTILYSYYRGCNRYYMYSVSQLAINLVMLIIVAIFQNKVYEIFLVWGILCIAITFVFLGKLLWKYHRMPKEEPKYRVGKECEELCIFSFPRLIGEIVLFSFTSIPLVIAAHQMGVDEGYLLSLPLNIVTMVTPIFSFAGIILLPLVSNHASKGDLREPNRQIKRMLLVYIVISVIGILGIEVLTEFIIKILFDAKYLESVATTRILALSILPTAIYLLLRNPIDAVTRIPFNTINLLISFLIMVLIMVFSSDYSNYAWAMNIGYTVLAVLSLISWDICKYRFNKRNAVKKENQDLINDLQ